MNRLVDELSSMMSREVLAVVDVVKLVTDPAFFGIGVPRGNGQRVVVIPGLFGNDLYLQPLNNWLYRIGYSPICSEVAPNAGCLQRLRDEILRRIDRRLRGDPRPIALIGHSRGGVLAWALASHLQQRVSHVVLLGSPVASFVISVETGTTAAAPSGQVGRMLMRASTIVRYMLDPDCEYPKCGCSFVRDAMGSLSADTSVLSIHGRNDLLVPKEAQVSENETLVVNASHVGLVYSPEVYRALGRFLGGTAPPSANRNVTASAFAEGSTRKPKDREQLI
jgi:pimeloyl-ACP methyl ester carboxylesterase